LDKQTGSSDRGCRWPLIISIMMMMMMMMMMAVICLFLLRKRHQRRNNKHPQDATGNQKPDSSPVSDNKDIRLQTNL
ncbi:hypothetical protein AMECASPLE_035101, partial [Ameca splendens]